MANQTTTQQKSFNLEELASQLLEKDKKFASFATAKVEHYNGDITKTLGSASIGVRHTFVFPDSWGEEHMNAFENMCQHLAKNQKVKIEWDDIKERTSRDGRITRFITAKSSFADSQFVRELYSVIAKNIDSEFEGLKRAIKSQNILKVGFSFNDPNSADDYKLGEAGFFGYTVVSDVDSRPNPKKNNYVAPLNMNVLYNMKNLPKGLQIVSSKKPNDVPEKVFATMFRPEGRNGYPFEAKFTHNVTIVAFELLGYEKGYEYVNELDEDGNVKTDKKGNPKTKREEAMLPKYGYKVWRFDSHKYKGKEVTSIKPESLASGTQVNHLEIVIANAIGAAAERIGYDTNIIDVVCKLEAAVERCSDINNPPTENDESGLFYLPRNSENSIGAQLEAKGKNFDDEENEEEDDIPADSDADSDDEDNESADEASNDEAPAEVEVGSLAESEDNESEDEVSNDEVPAEDSESNGDEVDAD